MSPPAVPPGRDRLALAACVLIAVAAYAATFRHGFAYDDLAIVVNNPPLHDLANWREILRSTWWHDAVYRPLAALTLALDWTVSGGQPWLFHGVNVVLHAVATALVFVLVRGMLGTAGGVVAGALFAVHPVHVEAVANVVGRAELLAGVFAIGAVLLYRADGILAAAGATGWRRGASALGMLGCLVLALASKETAFVLPGLLLLDDWWSARRRGELVETALRRHWVLWTASVALTAEWLWVWVSVVGRLSGGGIAPGLVGAGLGERMVVMAPVILEYLRLLLVPVRLSADYSPNFLPVSDHLTLRGVAGLAVLLALVAAAVAARRRIPAVTFGLAWVGGSLLIVSNILVPSEVLLAERTLYLPSVGAVVVLAGLWQVLAVGRPVQAAAVAALVVGLGLARTMTRVPVWRDNATLMPQLVRDAPGSFRSFWVAGWITYAAGDSTRGEALLRRAIATYPLHPGPWLDLGRQLEIQQRWGEAATAHAAAFRVDSTQVVAGARAVADLVRAGQLDSAVTAAARVHRAAPDHPAVLAVMADLAQARGRPREALGWFRQLAWRFPRAWQYRLATAAAAVDAGACAEARRRLREVEERQPLAPGLLEVRQRARAAGCGP